ncbi:MAG TPA: adenosine deaminase [Solirubrobacteraceae bacterium]|nr:adenosine deaminase [Solirubrobacteraceae bacterium]
MKDVPKAELHVHLEGTATPDLVRRIAARNGLEVPEGVFAAPDRFAWRDFLDFLNTYNMAASVIRTGEDYRDVAYEYLAACARDRTIYVELTASVDHARLVGLSDAEHWEGIAAGIDDARRDHGIEARILSVAVRNFGVGRAIEIAEHTAGRPHPYVVGFSLAGDEAGYPPEPYAEAYGIAAAAGLGCTVHAGEWAGADSVRGALELPVTRISHGVRAIEDPALVDELARRQVTLEVCPTSNVVLGVFPSYAEHPFPVLREAGIALTLGSDDPPYFGASLGGEYAVAREHFGLDDDELVAITRTAIEASFAEPALRAELLIRLTDGEVESR